MTQPQATRASASATAAAAPTHAAQRPAAKWKVGDLLTFGPRWGCSRATIRAGLRWKGIEEVSDPDEAKAAVEEFRKLDVLQYEDDQRAKRRQGRKG